MASERASAGLDHMRDALIIIALAGRASSYLLSSSMCLSISYGKLRRRSRYVRASNLTSLLLHPFSEKMLHTLCSKAQCVIFLDSSVASICWHICKKNGEVTSSHHKAGSRI
jgi:hypothetical protein